MGYLPKKCKTEKRGLALALNYEFVNFIIYKNNIFKMLFLCQYIALHLIPII